MIKTISDKFDGVIVDNSTLPDSTDGFRKEIEQLIECSKNKKLIWIRIPSYKADFIPILTKLHFEFHHCDGQDLMLIRKMMPDVLVPTTKNFIVGVGAIVVCDGKLLVIKDKFYAGYKLPGGHIDKDESIKGALKREVYEETGVGIEFESIVNIGHFRNGQFGESNLYIVCTARALSKEIYVNDSSEIAEARWIFPEVFLRSKEVNNYNKSVVKAAINNGELKLTEQKIELRVTSGEVFF
ncbi:NUDIX domain-containing protein [Marinilabilia sp.]|uniref:NUDIX domain-containing protein n=1 Tax=Marinilabilia sp. TaxID=2021252 RepID=UPI0025BAB7EB|nr:NUDIX domain-containing protein [Marinilabilia sp.]